MGGRSQETGVDIHYLQIFDHYVESAVFHPGTAVSKTDDVMDSFQDFQHGFIRFSKHSPWGRIRLNSFPTGLLPTSNLK